MLYRSVFLGTGFILAGCGDNHPAPIQDNAGLQTQESTSADSSRLEPIPNVPMEKVEDQVSANFSGIGYYDLSMNLHPKEWAGEVSPFISFRKANEPRGGRYRIPYITYYPPPGSQGPGYLNTTKPSFLIELNPLQAQAHAPSQIFQELKNLSVDLDTVLTLVTFSILTREDKGDPPIRTTPLSWFPHDWAHDVVKPSTDQSIPIASGFFNPQGIHVNSTDIQSNGPIGINQLKTYGAYIHPNAKGGSSYSSRQALFQLDPDREISDFWALSVDVDPTSSHYRSAVLIYSILFTGEQRDKLRGTPLFQLLSESEEARDKAAELTQDDTLYFKPFSTTTTVRDIIGRFEQLPSIPAQDKSRISKTLRALCQK